ncbi:MAG: hypothetical protein DWQ37_06775 [Planctomycetota bacterium]|nr:MAG: hypothetical protein DWQ37_06775 [Planctomycetota bacterium]
MFGETLDRPTEYFRPFPNAKEVFGAQSKEHANYLLPLASVALSRLNRRWGGWVHFVLPIEPYDGCVGQSTKRYHTYLCRENWIGFRINRRSCYQLAAPFRYFLMADLDERDDVRLTKRARSELETLYASTREAFANREAHYREAGALHPEHVRRRKGRYPESSRSALVRDIRGHPGWGNWVTSNGVPLAKRGFTNADGEQETDCIPLAEDGSEFTFVGWVPAYVYAPGRGCNVYLFYHRRQRLALTTFDWS